MSISGIYIIINNRNNLVYIGQSKDIKKRIQQHFSGSFIQDSLIDFAIKQEPENFSWKILQECPIDELNYYEQYYIYYFDSMNHGYNRTTGGQSASRSTILCGEQHPASYYTDEEILNIRKEYVHHSIEELYTMYKKNQSFYTFKNQILNSYTNLPRYNKYKKQWIYPNDWQGDHFNSLPQYTNSGLSSEDIMIVRRLSMTQSIEEIIHNHGLAPFKSYRHLRDTINGQLFNWLPYFSQKTQCWIYPQNWTGEKEKELTTDNWMDYFYRKEKSAGKKLSNYQVLQIRLLFTKGYNASQISKKLQLEDICSNDAIRLVINNKTYLTLPYLSKDKTWIFPDNLTSIQKDNFPLFLEIMQKELSL